MKKKNKNKKKRKKKGRKRRGRRKPRELRETVVQDGTENIKWVEKLDYEYFMICPVL